MSKVKIQKSDVPRVIAVDPGYDRCGVAVLEEGNLIFSTCFNTNKEDPFEKRLHEVTDFFRSIVAKWQPNIATIEKLYFNSNQKTAMKVSEVRGALVSAAQNEGLEIFQYTPLQIKMSVAGHGRATKKDVANMVPKLIKVPSDVKSDDELDAIAVGLTCLASYKLDSIKNQNL